MIARLQALTGLEFDIDAVKAGTSPTITGAVVDSTKSFHRTPFTTVREQHCESEGGAYQRAGPLER
jgi:hypothetical protein